MRKLPSFVLILMTALLFSCGSDSASDVTAKAETAAPMKSEAFAPAAEAMATGGSAAQVGSLLMQRFEAISDPNTGVLDPVASQEFISIATQLADKYPGDTLAALPLYRAAEVVRALNDPKKAAMMYERVHDEYKGFSKAPEALFMAAFTYDEDLKKYDMAKAAYEKFLQLYPENVFAESTPMLLENLGKSDEEILQQLEKKN